MSYTTFALSKLEAPKSMSTDGSATVSVTVQNTGARKGAEVVQLYVGNPGATVDRPVRELKGFQRVELAPGESKRVSFELDRRAISFYSTEKHAWVAEPGQFDVSVGSSSRDLALKAGFTVSR
jgi:beta-glucosidase